MAHKHLRVSDVYDLAADIGQEFERLMDAGVLSAENAGPLMQKTIGALEHLERFSAEVYADKSDSESEALKVQVHRLEVEAAKRTEERAKLDADLEQVEERYK